MGGASLSPNRWIRQRSSGLHRRPRRPHSGGVTTEEALEARQAPGGAGCHGDPFTSSSSSSLSVDPDVSSSSESEESLFSSSSSESDMSC